MTNWRYVCYILLWAAPLLCIGPLICMFTADSFGILLLATLMFSVGVAAGAANLVFAFHGERM